MTDDARQARRRQRTENAIRDIVDLLDRNPAIVMLEKLQLATTEQIRTLRVYVDSADYADAGRRMKLTDRGVGRRLVGLRDVTGLATIQSVWVLGMAERRGIKVGQPDRLYSHPTIVYRHFDAAGRLLYVGVAAKRALRHRAAHHRGSSEWWPLVARSTFEEFADRLSAFRAELDAIRCEHPRYNIAGRVA